MTIPRSDRFARGLLMLACLVGAAAACTVLRAADLSIRDVGAVPGADRLCTAAIQGAIDRLAAAGGGRVIVPPGVFTTGAIDLRQGVELHLADANSSALFILPGNETFKYVVMPMRI